MSDLAMKAYPCKRNQEHKQEQKEHKQEQKEHNQTMLITRWGLTSWW
jgi:hypothetical protein